ncbi:uncharacterized protein LOC117474524 [Tachysurus ichikawai]
MDTLRLQNTKVHIDKYAQNVINLYDDYVAFTIIIIALTATEDHNVMRLHHSVLPMPSEGDPYHLPKTRQQMMLYQSVLTSVILFAMLVLGGGTGTKLGKSVREAGSMLGMELDSVEAYMRMRGKLKAIIDNHSHDICAKMRRLNEDVHPQRYPAMCIKTSAPAISFHSSQ